MNRAREFLLQFFTWWNGSTLGVQLFTWWRGEFVGEDSFGNRYYRAPSAIPRSIPERRWVVYNGYADGSKVPPGWWGWMHHRDPLPPTSDGFQPKPWEKPHEPNLTGTPGAYHPTGSILYPKPEAQGEPAYQPWSPEP